MSPNGHVLHPVSGPKESVGGLLDNSIFPSRFLHLDQVRRPREREREFFVFARPMAVALKKKSPKRGAFNARTHGHARRLPVR